MKVPTLLTENHTCHTASAVTPSKCLASVSHTQPGISPIGSAFDLERPVAVTSSCPRRAYLLNCIVPSQPEYMQGFRSPLSDDIVDPSSVEDVRVSTVVNAEGTTSYDDTVLESAAARCAQ
jgi:hypothetical protein